MWKEIKEQWGLDGFKAMDAVVQGMSSALWSDFNFCGPAVTAPRVFPAVASAHMLLCTFVYDETKIIYPNENLPIRKYFSGFIEKLQEGGTRKKGN
jgi:tetrahydromethanopterin S-methyltransferase subunit H